MPGDRSGGWAARCGGGVGRSANAIVRSGGGGTPLGRGVELLIFAYDRRALRRCEILVIVRAPGAPCRVIFLNENNIDSGEHGAAFARRRWGQVWEIEAHFNCLGDAVWRQCRSRTNVIGTWRFMEGRDSRGRAVRMSALACARTEAAVAAGIRHYVREVIHFRGVRLFADHLRTMGRLLAPPAVAGGDGPAVAEEDWVWVAM